MGNLPSCFGIISKHVYPLELPKIAPFCMKITKNNSGGGFFTILLRIKINSLALVYLKINFLVELMLKINNLSRQNFPALPSLRIKWLPPKTSFCIMMSLRYCTCCVHEFVYSLVPIVNVTISYHYHTTKTVYGSDLASLTDTVASLYTKEKVKHGVRKSIPNKVML